MYILYICMYFCECQYGKCSAMVADSDVCSDGQAVSCCSSDSCQQHFC